MSRCLPVLISLWILLAGQARADIQNPLRPVDTSSPRDTLMSFIETTERAYKGGIGLVPSYIASSRAYLTSEEIASIFDSRNILKTAKRCLDLSLVPPAMIDASSRNYMIELKEILDRLHLPDPETIPDAEAAQRAELKRWSIPNTEIHIVRMESGPHTGEYLFSADTVERLGEIYETAKHLPYVTTTTAGWYEFQKGRPIALAVALNGLVPPRWVASESPLTRYFFLDQPLWRWLAMVVVSLVYFLLNRLSFRLTRHLIKKNDSALGFWAPLLRPAVLAATTAMLAQNFVNFLRISDSVYAVVTPTLLVMFYLALTWLTWVMGTLLAENMIYMERLKASSIDSQLIRLVMRLVTLCVTIFILVTGADKLGLPAYSVLAGLGVSGFAVALAAQQTLANLLGSLIIMFEKPFSIGDEVRVKGAEGVVESVGFRSTRIRTANKSIVTIPSSQLVNSAVDNQGSRKYREVRTTLSLSFETPSQVLTDYISEISDMLAQHPLVHKKFIRVGLVDVASRKLDIALSFLLKTPDDAGEIRERQAIFIKILKLAEEKSIDFV